MYTSISIFAGFILDLFLGDPYWMPHPVRAMGEGEYRCWKEAAPS